MPAVREIFIKMNRMRCAGTKNEIGGSTVSFGPEQCCSFHVEFSFDDFAAQIK